MGVAAGAPLRARADEHAAATSREAKLAHAREIVTRYGERFRVVDASVARDLGGLYASDIAFTDPVSKLRGLDELRAYFRKFPEQSRRARFEIRAEIVDVEQAAAFWTMVFPATESDPERSFEGISHLQYAERIHTQRDYFDLGAAVYQHVPVLGWITNLVDQQLAPE